MKFIGEDGWKKYGFNTGWLVLDRGCRIITNLITSAAIARYLEPDHFGILSYVLSLVNLFAAFSNLGFDEIIVALARGGALETVVHEKTGLLVSDATARGFADAITAALSHRFDPDAIRHHAEQFIRDRFGDEIETVVRASHETPGC